MTRRTLSRTVAVAAGTAISISAVPSAAPAAPSQVGVGAPCLIEGSNNNDLSFSLNTLRGDGADHAISITYENGSFVVVDDAGVVPTAPPLPEDDNLCVAVTTREVRCPVDLADPRIQRTSFYVLTTFGDDVIDLRRLPTLPGLQPNGTASFGDGPSHPLVGTHGGHDTVLAGDYGTLAALGEGHDRFFGGAGRDGGIGTDGGPIRGWEGRDRLIGGGGNDWLAGEQGVDFLKGGSGQDILEGWLGADKIHSRDGAVDRISCGKGDPAKQWAKRDRKDEPVRKYKRWLPINC
jgi:Ca2+-binding RTX toxin-like protein